MPNSFTQSFAADTARNSALAADEAAHDGDEDAYSVTVVIPVYNGARFVAKAIESVLAQTLAAKEVLVINDGSTDNTLEVLEGFGKAVTVISQPNGGLSNARNTGIRMATGGYIGLLDADDWWHPRKLESQVAVMRATPNAAANYTGVTTVNAATSSTRSLNAVDLLTFLKKIQWCNPGIPPSSMLLSKRALDEVGRFDERFRACEDWDLWFRLLQRGYVFTVSPEPLTYYLAGAGGMSSDADYMYRSFLPLLDRALLAGRTGLSRWIWRQRILSYQAYKAVLTARAEGKTHVERRYMWKSLLSWPSPFWAPERFKVFAVTLLRSR